MFLTLCIMFLFAHALCDFPLQGDFVSTYKARYVSRPVMLPDSTPQQCYNGIWWLILFMHSAIHAGAVFVVVWFFIPAVPLVWMQIIFAFELVVHFLTDHLKCEGALGKGTPAFVDDQLLHVLFKVLYAAFLDIIRN